MYFDTNTVIAVKLDFLSAEGTPLLSLATNPALGQSTSLTLTADSPPGSVTVRPSLCIGPSTVTNGFSLWDDAGLSYASDTLTTLYVAVSSTNPVPPYGDWSTAATSIQAAVDVAQNGATVIVGDGTYASGAIRSGDGYGVISYGHYTDYNWYWDQQLSRLVIDKPVIVQSLNGPGQTILLGDTNTRCAYLKNGAALIGFTLKEGNASCVENEEGCYGGGGAMLRAGSLIRDCLVISNSATEYGGGVGCWYGGRVERCTLEGNNSYHGGGLYVHDYPWWSLSGDTSVVENCTLIRNRGTYGANAEVYLAHFRNCLFAEGRGQYGSGIRFNARGLVENCTIVSNSAIAAGGILFGTNAVIIRNSVIYGNTHDTNYAGPDGYNWLGSTDQPVFVHSCTFPLPPGEGNIDAPPMLKSGTYELCHGSPCIDSGLALSDMTNDLRDAARPVDGNGDGSAEFDMGAYEYDTSMADSDDDGMTDDHEDRAGCGPNDPTSCLRFSCPILLEDSDARIVRWQSIDGKRYNLLRTSDLRSGFSPIATGIDATAPENTFTDLTAPASQPSYYRVELAE